MKEYTIKSTGHFKRQNYHTGIIEVNSDNKNEKVFILKSSAQVRTILRLTYEFKSEKPVKISADIVYQKKARASEWEDDCNRKLTEIKSGEGIKHSLDPTILASLNDLLTGLPELAEQMNEAGPPLGNLPKYKVIQPGSKQWKGAELAESIELLDSQGGIDALKGIASWLNNNQGTVNISSMTEKEHHQFRELGEKSNLELLIQAYEYWENNCQDQIEENWQRYFTERPYILNTCYPSPSMIIGEKAYIGGKGFDRKGGSEVDYLLSNPVSGNVVLIEIKTPLTPLMGKMYRNQAYNVSADLAGAVQQSLNYLQKIRANFQSLKAESDGEMISQSNCFHPKVMLIIGNNGILGPDESRGFELFRNSIKDVEIITYNELFLKVKNIYDALTEHNVKEETQNNFMTENDVFDSF